MKLLNQLNNLEKNGVELEIWVCSDGSTDQTDNELANNFPWVNLVKTSGSLFWARSMNRIDVASFESKPDYTLWLNNDTVLFDDFFSRLSASISSVGENAILVGALCDPETGDVTYTGCVHKYHLGADLFQFIPPLGLPVRVGMFSGNCVLVPNAIRGAIGPISKIYRHGWADMDYGMLASKHGFETYLMGDFIGFGALNPLYSFHTDSSQGLGKRLRHAFGKKGYHPVDYFLFCARALPLRRALRLYLKNMFRILLESVYAGVKRT